MQKKITETTAATGLGHGYQSSLMRVVSGPYLGRLVAVMQTAPGEIKLSWSDAPSSSWSAPQAVVTDAANETFDCRMDELNNILLVYTDGSTGHLTFRKLSYDSGQWTTGSPVVIFNGNPGFDPSLALDSEGTLWVSWSRFLSPVRRFNVKSSVDGGATWGSGPEDSGDEVKGTVLLGWSLLVTDQNNVSVIYVDQDNAISFRSRPLTGGGWSEAYNVTTGSGFDRNFDAALSADGRLGVVFNNGGLLYREYDGSVWQAPVTIDTDPGYSPQLAFEQNIPVITYLSLFTGSQMLARCSNRRTGSFSTPVILDDRARSFDSVVLYEVSSDNFQNLTTAAENSVTADLYHADSGRLLSDVGDAVYLGMDNRFRLCRFLLSTPGAGGTVELSYWDGSAWQTFTPVGGTSDFSTATVDLLFWTDFYSIPANWQKGTIDGKSRFWLKIEVTSAFSTGPVGSQVTAVSELSWLKLRR